MLSFIFDILILILVANWFYADYQESKQQGRSLKDYKRGIVLFFAILALMDISINIIAKCFT